MSGTYKDPSLFNRLKRLFSSDVVIRNVGGNELKVVDINKIQSSGKYQTNSLVDRFSRLYIYNNKNIFNPALNFQTLRIQMYSDYEACDQDAIISSALDVVADECLLKNDKGKILNITSSDENIKRILENLFYDILNIDFNLWSWTREMLKYGDFFLKLEISEKYGIYNVLPYSVYHISRLEGIDPDNPTKVYFDLDPDGLAASQDPNYVPKDGKGVIRLQNYEVAHFRLLTDIGYLPYGRSYIEPARKIFKQLTLCLPGTATIWTPNGYTTMQDIKVGDAIYCFDYKTNSFVESEVTYKIDTGHKATYKIWTKHRCLEASGDHPVMVQDGTFKKVSELTTSDYIIPAGNAIRCNTKTEAGVPIEKITKIEKVSDSKQVYDITVASNLHNFIADGVVVSNCEDAAMIHRIMRAPEKRIFYINVGNVPPNEVENYMQRQISKMKKTPYVSADGQYNLRFNMQNMMEDFYIPVRGGETPTKIETSPGLNYDGIKDIEYYQQKLFAALKIPRAYLGYEGSLCIAPDTKIRLLNGTSKTVKELISDYEKGIQNYTYSIDEGTKNVVPGKIMWAGYTRKNAEVNRVWLDNGNYIDCTPDHLFMTRDGEWIEAQSLLPGQSLMPLYEGKNKLGYTTVYNPADGQYKPVHRIVPEYYGDIERGNGKVVHHVDCNKLNNYPDNLNCSMNFWEHRQFHSQRVKELVQRLKEQGYYESGYCKEQARANGRKGGLKSAKKLGEWAHTHHPWNYIGGMEQTVVCPVCGKEFRPFYYSVKSKERQLCCGSKCAGQYKHEHPELYNLAPNSTNKRKFIDVAEFYRVAAEAKNFVEIMQYFNITKNTFDRFLADHNIDKLTLVHEVMLESHKNKGFYNNFRRRNHKVVKVEKLTERIDTCDIKIEQHHNFATDAGVFIHNSGKATLSAEDIRFARTVERIQKVLESELTKIALIHLYTQGYTGESLTNFELKLTTPSIIFEQEKIALLKEKVDLSAQMKDTGMFSSDYIYENIFGLSEDDYLEMRDLVREDAKRNFRISQIENEGNDPAVSGRSYGTPHDLASMYGRRSSPAPKGAENVPTGYAEPARQVPKQNISGKPKWGEPGPEGGRPRVHASFFNTQKNPAGGADPTGRYGMHGNYPSDYENVMEEGEEGHGININLKKQEACNTKPVDIIQGVIDKGMLSEELIDRVERLAKLTTKER